MESKKRIVVIGAGFGGLALVQGLKNADAEITLIDKRNHHLFQPLLYQVATAGLSASDVYKRQVMLIYDESVNRVNATPKAKPDIAYQ